MLAYPEVEISTAWAYDQLGPILTENSPYFNFIVSLSGGCVDHDRLFEVLENDFTPAVERTYPIVAELRSQLDRVGARATLMSGSGSTVLRYLRRPEDRLSGAERTAKARLPVFFMSAGLARGSARHRDR